MFKRYCDCCGKEVGLRMLAKANDAGKQLYEGLIKCGDGEIYVRCEAAMSSGKGGTDVCENCAKEAIRKILEPKKKKKKKPRTAKKKAKRKGRSFNY